MRPPPEEPARRARHAELLHVLADGGALLRVGKRKEAAILAETLVADARALGDPPLLAEATLLQASSLSASGQADRAVEVFRAAVLAAAAAGDPRLEARAWVDLITLSVNAGRGRPPDDVIMAARAAVARTDGDLEVAMAFEQAMAMVAITESHPDEAERNWRRAQAAAAAGLPEDHPRQAQTRLGIATSLAEQHRYDDALAMLIEARTAAERIYGPTHPDVANYWGNTFVVLFELGRYEEALAAAERVVAIAEPGTSYAGLGTVYQANALTALDRAAEAAPRYQAAIEIFERAGNHAQEFQALLSLGVDQYSRREHAAATATLERAVAVGTKVYGADGGNLAHPTTLLGIIAAAQAHPDLELSLRRCRDAVALATKAWGPDDSELTLALVCVAKAQRLTGDPAGARASAERAVANADRSPQLLNQVEARLELARVFLALRERGRARELVKEAMAREADPDEDAAIDDEFGALLK
jgi:tetratricopeptide (TPR) repeat protein